MKKIMFNDRYGLTQAVLDGRKTQTRRIITCPKEFKGEWVAGFYVYTRQSDNAIINWPCMYDADECTFDGGEILPKYKVGEVVAVAQSYKDAGVHFLPKEDDEFGCYNFPAEQTNGWNNKLYVRSGLMKHRIRITDVRVERLQDIDDESCLSEGIIKEWHAPACRNYYYIPNVVVKRKDDVYMTPREAYAALIDKIAGKGVWDSNPYVFVYEFELMK